MFQPFLPATANPIWLFGVFFGALVLFDLLLVRWLRLGRRAWKYVDYIWLAAAVVGLLGAATEVRRIVASNQIGFANAHKVSAYQLFLMNVGFTGGGAACRPFQRSEFSPPNLDEIQREYDLVCEFGKQLRARLPSEPPDELDVERFSRRPQVRDGMLNQIYGELDLAVLRYKAVEKAVAETVAAAQRSDSELTFSILAPLLLAIALALRITKVTGELRLEA